MSAVFATAIGGAASQTSIVAVLNAAGIGGGAFLIAFFVALILALCYLSSYSELSVMMPKAGSISTYTAVSLGHFPAIVATILGSVGPAIFAAPAEFLLLDHLLHVSYPGMMAHPSLVLWTIFTILNILGVNVFSSAQKIMTYVMLIALLVVAFYGFGLSNPKGIAFPEIISSFGRLNGSILSLIMLAFFPFTGFEAVCSLAEEVKKPGKNMPGGLFLAIGALFVIYLLYALAAIMVVPPDGLTSTDIPHSVLAQAIFGKAGTMVILVLGIATTSAAMNASVAAQARLLFGMAHHNQVPAIFKRVQPMFRTPWVSLVAIYLLSGAMLLLFGDMPDFILTMVISASSAWLVVYIIANINVIILRFRYPHFKRPFQTPFYPILQIIGIIGMAYAIVYNSPSPAMANKVYINSSVLMGLTCIYAFFRVRYKMKRKLFEPEPIQQAIAD